MFGRKKKDKPIKPTGLKALGLPRFILSKIHLIILTIVATYIGVNFSAGMYYLLTQTTDVGHNLWHALCPDDGLRSDLRAVGEGLIGGMFAKAIVWNHWKIKKPRIFDKLEMKLRIPNMHDEKDINIGHIIAAPLMIALYAIPGFLLSYWIVHEIQWLFTQSQLLNMHLGGQNLPPITTRLKDNWTADWPQKLMGFFCTFFFGKHIAKGLFDDAQQWFAHNRIIKERQLEEARALDPFALATSVKNKFEFLLPPTYRARIDYERVQLSGVATADINQNWEAKVIVWSLPVFLIVAGFGWYVLNWVAYGH